MNPSSLALPAPFWITSIGAMVCVVALLFWGLARTQSKSSLRINSRRTLVGVTALVTVTWGAAVLYLASHDVFQFSPRNPFPYIGLGVALPVLVGAALFRFVRPLQEALLDLPQEVIIGVHGFRVVGLLFIIAMLRGQLPPIFALPAGIGDLVAAVGALEVAYLARKGSLEFERLATIWNIFGILDLVVAVGIGFLASVTPLRLIFSDPNTNLMTQLPLVVVPVFGIPLYISLHALSLRKLARQRRPTLLPISQMAVPTHLENAVRD